MRKNNSEVRIDLEPGAEFELFARAVVGVPKSEIQIELQRETRAKAKKK